MGAESISCNPVALCKRIAPCGKKEPTAGELILRICGGKQLPIEPAQGSGGSCEMLRKVKRIKLGRRLYRRLMKRVLERDGWPCQNCGSLENLQVHHKTKRSQRGNDSLANPVALCAYCHLAEHGQLFYSVPAVRICSKPKLRGK